MIHSQKGIGSFPTKAEPIPSAARRDMVLVFFALFVVTAAVNLQIPLFHAYVEKAGLGLGVTGLVFGAYVAGLLPTLILLGGVSDRFGRKPVLKVAVGCAMVASLLMALKADLASLFLARPLQGVGVGLAVGTGTAYLTERLEAWRSRAWVASRVAVLTSLGFGSGALLTGTWLLVDYRLNPPTFLLVTLMAVFILVGLMRLQGTATRMNSMISLPILPQRFWTEYVSIAMAWAITGIVISILPAEMHRRGMGAYSGHALFLVNLTGAIVSPLARRLTPAGNLACGYFLLPLGYAALLLGLIQSNLLALFCGAILVGSACYGFTYYGGLNKVNSVPSSERARTVSGYFLMAYLGFGLPSVALGYMSDRIGILPSLECFGALLLLVCVSLFIRLRLCAIRF